MSKIDRILHETHEKIWFPLDLIYQISMTKQNIL